MGSPSMKKLMKRYKRKCHYCGRHVQVINQRLPSFATRDHIVPRSKGGLWSKHNIALACQRCNSEKGSKDLSEFVRLHQKLEA